MDVPCGKKNNKYRHMKLTVLNDNAPGDICKSEHGLSYFIEADKKILLDTGASDLFLKNAALLNIDLEDIDTVVLSHGHWDHGNGLIHLKNKSLITHPDSFQKKYRKKDRSYIGLPLSETEAANNFKLITTKKPYQISEQIVFLGEIPRLNNFEAKTTSFELDNGTEDFVLDDSAIAVKTTKGLVVVSGCAHSGICNIIDYAQKVTGIKTVYGVIGGFHLKKNDTQTQKTIDYFKKQDIQAIYPSHCTALPALAAFYQTFDTEQVLSGQIIYF
jgi:7,8-dihydropterin-6-yl-methyl-4-(beta-D-ribofuranosyl)aminobenzene 5'-phosphate synthase